MLEIKNFSVNVENKEIIRNINLEIKDGETHVIMGPNGAGKSTFTEALLGHPGVNVNGKIILNGEDVSKSKTDERARKGMFLIFQHPEEIEGVTISNFIRKARSTSSEEKKDLDQMLQEHRELEKNAERLGIPKEFIKRELNVGFSGGEKKRMEMLQAISLNPSVMIIDEIDSGLDVDGLKLIAKTIEEMKNGKRSFLIITHYPRILTQIKIDYVHIIVNGKIVKTGGPQLAQEIEADGYSSYLEDSHV